MHFDLVRNVSHVFRLHNAAVSLKSKTETVTICKSWQMRGASYQRVSEGREWSGASPQIVPHRGEIRSEPYLVESVSHKLQLSMRCGTLA